METITVKALKALLEQKTMAELVVHFQTTPDALRHFMRKNGMRKPNPTVRPRELVNRIMTYFERNGVKKTMAFYKMTKDQVKCMICRERARRTKRIARYTPLRVAKLRAKARRIATEGGMAHMSEDFASYCVVYAFKGHAFQIENVFIDYMRSEHGRTGTSYGELKQKATLRTASLFAESEDGSETGEEKFAGPDMVDSLGRWREIADGLAMDDERERVMFFLFYYLECTQEEIGTFYNISGSRVSQMLTKVVSRISETNKEFFKDES